MAQLSGNAVVNPFSGDEIVVAGTAVGAFGDKNVAPAKSVSVSGLSLTGYDAGNYNLLPLTNLTAAITPAPLQISASSDSKIYDGTIQSSLVPTITKGGLWGDDSVTGLAQVYGSPNVLGAGQSKLIVSAYKLSDGNNGNNYALDLLSSSGTIQRAIVTPYFMINDKPFDGTAVAQIAGNGLKGGLARDEIFLVGASAIFDNAFAGNDKLVTITGFTLSGQAANNYQLSSPTVKTTASITSRQATVVSPTNEEPIKDKQASPDVDIQAPKISSPTASNPVSIDNKDIISTPPTTPAPEATPSGPMLSEPAATTTAMSASSATKEYQESDQRSADVANTSLGLANDPSGAAMSPARLQLVMQSAASFIRKYPVRMLNP